jgi:hypothetical protein
MGQKKTPNFSTGGGVAGAGAGLFKPGANTAISIFPGFQGFRVNAFLVANFTQKCMWFGASNNYRLPG